MKSVQPLAYPLRLPEEYMEKLKIIAKDNGRSVNKEIEILVKNHIAKTETEKGMIFIDKETN